ncbi:MAG: FAD/NAD(P)-binding oxidoreductase [Nitrososphaerota archaeon]
MRPVRVAVVGGGTGGTLVANKLATELRDRVRRGEVEVHLFTERPEHYFQPANLDIAFKGAEPRRFVRDERELVVRGVNLHLGGVKLIDLGNRTLLFDGSSLEFDYLVVATGSRAMPELIEGLAESSYNFHTGQADARRTWEAVRKLERGRVVILVNVPHKCPPSPVEAAFLLDEHLRRRGVRENVEIVYATPYTRAYPTHSIAEVVEPLFERKGIEVVTLFNTDYVDVRERRVRSLEGEELRFDLLITVPPHRGAEVITASGLGDEEGWVPTEKETLRVKGYDYAYAIGDATDIPISKSGVVAHLEAIVAAKNVIADIEGTGVEHCYTGRINCPLEVGDGRALFVSGTYAKPPERQEPSRLKYLMKRTFPNLYWAVLKGRFEAIFDLYLGKPYTVRGARG